MYKMTFPFLLMMALCMDLNSAAYAQIVVEDASAVWEKATEIPSEVPDIPPRFICEYATTIYHQDMVYPEDLINDTSFVPSRIIVEYATAIARFDLATFPACECDLNHDHNCDMQDWLIFGEDWGRTDCIPAEDCECDLNHDGRCDMQDWLLFGEDWGRTDCPIYPQG